MNIALVTPEFNTQNKASGEVSDYLFCIAKALAELGHRPVVFVNAETDEKIIYKGIEVYQVKIEKRDEKWYSHKILHKPYTFAKRNFYANTRWHKIDYHLEQKHYPETLSSQLNRAIERVHKEIHFDVIHYTQENATGYHRVKNIPCVVQVSCPYPLKMHYEGLLMDVYRRTKEKYEKASLEKADELLCFSEEIAEMTERKTGRKVNIVKPPFFNDTTEKDESLYEQHLRNKKYLLFYGTLNLLNGTDTVADMLADFFRKYPSYNFVFVGDSSISPYPKLNMRQYVLKKAMEFANRVICLDAVPQNQLIPIIEKCEMVVLTGRHDSFSNLRLKAMAQRRLVITTKHSGYEGLIEHGQNGFLINKEAHKELLKTVSLVLTMPENEKRKIEEEAYKSTLIPAQELVDFYSKAINKFKNK